MVQNQKFLMNIELQYAIYFILYKKQLFKTSKKMNILITRKQLQLIITVQNTTNTIYIYEITNKNYNLLYFYFNL